MLPKQYVKEVERQKKAQYLFKHLILSTLIIGSMYFFGALIHEFSHIAWLELQNCYHTTSFSFSFLSGITGAINPLCSMAKSTQLVFYSIGYLSTSIIGFSLILIGDIQERGQNYFLASGIGMLLSVLLTINTKGDLVSLLNLLGFSENNYFLISIFITLGLLSTSFKAAEMLLESLERKESGTN